MEKEVYLDEFYNHILEKSLRLEEQEINKEILTIELNIENITLEILKNKKRKLKDWNKKKKSILYRFKKFLESAKTILTILKSSFFDPLILYTLILGIPVGYYVHTRYLTLINENPDSYWIDLLVEAHGLIYDVLFFSFLIAFFSNILNRRKKIDEYIDEIEDYLGMQTKNARFKVINSIKHLNKQKVSNIKLSNCYLKKGKLEKINLSGSLIDDSNLNKANLEGANLNETFIVGSKLKGANIRNASLNYSYLSYSNLTHSNLEGSILIGADFEDAELNNATITNANLFLCNFVGSNLMSVDFRGSNLSKVNFINAFLVNANLDGLDLRNVKMDEANLFRTNLVESNFTGVDFKETIFEKANLERSILKGANLSNINLIGANLWGAILDNANLNEADLQKAILIETSFRNSNLTNTNLNDAIVTNLDWFEQLEEMQVIGYKEIQKKYVIEYNSFKRDGFDYIYFQLKEKKTNFSKLITRTT